MGEGFLATGEAAFTLDPLSSTGVQKAMQTAWLVHQGILVPA